MPRKSVFSDRIRHDIDLVFIARRAKSVAHYSYADEKFILKTGSKLAEEASDSLYDSRYSRILDYHNELEENGVIINNVTTQDLTFNSLWGIASFVSLGKVNNKGIKILGTNVYLTSAIENNELYNKYIAKCKYYDSDWNVIYNADKAEDGSDIVADESDIVADESDIVADKSDIVADGSDNIEADTVDSLEINTEEVIDKELNEYSTSEIIREILIRILNSSK